jgi:tRNA threonylcarbamoyladenosine biosynthesis protein TsaB
MLSLLIETSTEQGVVAIISDQKIAFQGHLPPGFQNSKYLLPEIEKGMRELKLKFEDLSYIAVGIGPGSYTGIRVGVITAKILAFSANRPLIGVCTLETFVPDQENKAFAVLIDAKIGGAYLITGQKHPNTVEYFSPPKISELRDLGDLLKIVDVIVTPQINPLRSKIENIYPENSWKWQEKGPDLLHMNHIANNKYQSGLYTLDGHLEILYMRKTQAEIEREVNNCRLKAKAFS